MKTSILSTLLLAVTVQLASAGIVITNIYPDQVVEKGSDDCYFGVVTPQGCG